MKKKNLRNLVNSVKLAGLMGVVTLTGCCGHGCHDCGCHGRKPVIVKEKPSISVGGDAIIINGDNNDATMIKGNGNNSANRSSGNQNVAPRKPVKPIVKPDPVKPQPAPEPKPDPEEDCITIITTERSHFELTGDANDVVRRALEIVNANGR